MDPVTAGVMTLSAGANFGGSAYQAYTSQKIADKQMKFQERMSSTAYQRAVKDLREAGLNPMLAYTQGGASSPQGASGQAPNFGGVVSSALEAKRTIQELQNLKSQNELLDAQVDQSLAQANKIDLEAEAQESINKGLQVEAQIDDSMPGKFLRLGKRVVDVVNPFNWFKTPQKVLHYRKGN